MKTFYAPGAVKFFRRVGELNEQFADKNAFKFECVLLVRIPEVFHTYVGGNTDTHKGA
ncbi:hypothetical protein GCM10011346_30150 [Oceanobacillus neutriphilus]|uniref:Uncharacterized protein n=1 Tax=Oceanobacillus neutriphilus TaxID=531815 RepID=A0ABQ2NX68_9BACI|nr:hypothetical protein GCM10011346_30150 [Oceanobacillus neutriphilus]